MHFGGAVPILVHSSGAKIFFPLLFDFPQFYFGDLMPYSLHILTGIAFFKTVPSKMSCCKIVLVSQYENIQTI